MIRIPLLICCAAVFAYGASIDAPRAGTVHYANGSVYPMFGLSRSLIAGYPLASGVYAAAFSDRTGIVAVESGLNVLDFSGAVSSHLDTDSQHAVLAIATDPSYAGACAVAWLPASNSLASFAAGAWRTTVLADPLPGAVIAVRCASKDTAHLLLAEGEQVFELTVGYASGHILLQRLLPEAKLPATYLADGLLFQDGEWLVYQSISAGKKTLRFNGHIDAFEQMSAEAVHATGDKSASNWMLELTRSKGIGISELPAAPLSLAGDAR